MSDLALCFLTSGPYELDLACRYWERKWDVTREAMTWANKVADLAGEAGVNQPQFLALVNKACSAVDLGDRCVCCGQPHPIQSRAGFSRHASELDEASRQNVEAPYLCSECLDEVEKDGRAAKSFEDPATPEFVDVELPKPVHYGELTFEESLLLRALIASYGGALSSGLLLTNRRNMAAFADEQQFIDIVRLLHGQGWIYVGPSRRSALILNSDSTVTVDPSKVDWCLSPDPQVKDFLGFDRNLQDQMHLRAFDETLEGAFRRVCMAELRALYFFSAAKFGFDRASWKPAVEQGIAKILEHVGLGQAKNLVYRVFKRLGELRGTRTYRLRHIDNMIDGAFSRAIDSHVANGWMCYSFERYPHREPFATRLLFSTFEADDDLYFPDAWKYMGLNALEIHLNTVSRPPADLCIPRPEEGAQAPRSAGTTAMVANDHPGPSDPPAHPELPGPPDGSAESEDNFALLVDLLLTERAAAERPGYDLKRAELLRGIFASMPAPQEPADTTAPTQDGESFPGTAKSGSRKLPERDYFTALWAFNNLKGHGNVPPDWPDRDLAEWFAREVAASGHPSYDQARRDRLVELGVTLLCAPT